MILEPRVYAQDGVKFIVQVAKPIDKSVQLHVTLLDVEGEQSDKSVLIAMRPEKRRDPIYTKQERTAGR